MTYCTWDNLLLYLCLNGCNLKVSSSRDGWVGSMFVSISRWKGVGGGLIKGKVSQLVNTKSVFIKEEGRTGSVLFRTGTFFCTKVIIKAQLLLIRFTMDGCYQKSQGCFLFLFFYFSEDKETLFCMIKCCLFIG